MVGKMVLEDGRECRILHASFHKEGGAPLDVKVFGCCNQIRSGTDLAIGRRLPLALEDLATLTRCDAVEWGEFGGVVGTKG